MQLKCPRCKTVTSELIECEGCKTIGCIRCITRYNKQWICENCKNRQYTTSVQSPDSALAAMFG